MRVNLNDGPQIPKKLEQGDLSADVVIVTIAEFSQVKLKNGDLVRHLYFRELDKPLRLNKTQIAYLIEGLGTDESTNWVDCVVPIERTEKEGPDANMHNVVWVSAPESWASLFAEAGEKLPAHQRAPVVKTVAAAGKGTKEDKPRLAPRTVKKKK